MATAASEVPALARDRAFESLYRRYADDVYRYALALLRNPADAEDVTQTTFMNAYRAVKRGEKIQKPQNWLIKIAHNAARSRYARASRRVDEVPLEDHLEHLAVPEVERPQVQDVLDALGRLPLNQRAALVMRELEGRTYAEIADTLGVSVSAVETLIFRARRSLRVKASAIRVLGVVPAPGWLWNLLDAGGGVAGSAAAGGAAMGGGAAAGSGSIVGSGFLLKTAVAIVAGVVASGINSDNPRKADAANAPALSSIAVSHANTVSSGRAARGDGRTAGDSAAEAASRVVGGSEGRAGEAPGLAAGEQPIAARQSTAPRASVIGTGAAGGGLLESPASSGSTTSSGSRAPAPIAATQVVTTTVATVTSAVPLPAVPSVPVSVSVPSAPVQVPSAPVQVPAAPAKLPPPPVKLSPPPVQLPPAPVSLP